jgi:hypothetical protein
MKATYYSRSSVNTRVTHADQSSISLVTVLPGQLLLVFHYHHASSYYLLQSNNLNYNTNMNMDSRESRHFMFALVGEPRVSIL